MVERVCLRDLGEGGFLGIHPGAGCDERERGFRDGYSSSPCPAQLVPHKAHAKRYWNRTRF